MDYSIRNTGERSPVKYIKRNRLDPSGPPPAVGAACFSEQHVEVKGSQQLALPQRQKVESDVYGNEYLAVDPSATNTKEIIFKGAELRGRKSYKVAVEKIKKFFPHPLYADTIECEELFYEFCNLMGLNNCYSSQSKVEDGVFLHAYEVEFFSGSFYWVGTVGEFMPRHNAAKELAFALACVKLIEELRYELKSRLGGKYSEAKKTEDSEDCVETSKNETREVRIESSTAMVKSRQRFIPTVPKNSGYGLRGLPCPPPRPLMDFANIPKYRPKYQQRFIKPAHFLISSPSTKPDAFGNVNEVAGSAVNSEYQELRCTDKLSSIAMTSDSVNLKTLPELTCFSNNPDYEYINNNQTDLEVQNGVSSDEPAMSLAGDGPLSEARLDVAEENKGACAIMAEQTYESNANKHSNVNNANTHQQVHGTNAESSTCVLRDKILRSVSPQCQLPSVSKCFYNGVCLERLHTTENKTDDVSANELKPNIVRDAMSCDQVSKKVNTKGQTPNPNTVQDTSSCEQIPEKVGTEESKPVGSKNALEVICSNYGYGYDESDEESIKWQSSEPYGKSNKKIAQIPFTGFTSFEENKGCNQTTSSVIIPKLIQKPFSPNYEERFCSNETHVSKYCQLTEQYKKERHSVSLRHQEEQFSSTSLLPSRKQLKNSCKTYYQNALFGNYPPVQRPALRLPRSQHVGPRRPGPGSAVSPRNSVFYQQPRLTIPPTREFGNSNSSNFSHSPLQKTLGENHHDRV